MKPILRALWALKSTEPLLALETLAQPDTTGDWGGDYTVRIEDGHQAMAPAGAGRRPLLVAQHQGDSVCLLPQVLPQDMPQEVLHWLRLLGEVRKGPVGCGAPIPLEELGERIDSLRHALSVLQFAGTLHGDAVEFAAALLAHANHLRSTRGAAFEAENTAGTSTSRLDTLHKNAEQARANALAFAAQHTDEISIRLEDDPRGSTMVVTNLQSRARQFICGANLSWPLPEALDWKLTRSRTVSRIAKHAEKEALEPRSRTAVDDAVTGALLTAVARGNDLLITEQLDPATYAKVKAILTSLGGKWVRSRQVHCFDRSAEQVLAELRGGTVVTDRDWEFFPTPEDVVQRMLALAGDKLRPGVTVGEPEAGRGAIALAAAQIVGKASVDCTEAMPLNAQCLRDLGFKVHEGDFLARPQAPLYDVVLMNPPFSQHQDAAHITHALGFLKPGGVLVACASRSWQQAGVAKAQAFRELLEQRGAEVEEVEAGAFRESGTEVATVLIRIEAPAVELQAETTAKPHAAQAHRDTPAIARAPQAKPQSVQLTLSLFDA